MPNIVEIVVRGIDQTKAPFTTAITNMAGLEKVAKGLVGVLGGLAATAATSLVALTASAIKTADEMGKAAQRAGLGVEAFSKLAHAAKLADVETKTLETGFKTLNKTLVEAVNDSTSRAARIFQQLGVSVVDANGKIRASDVVFQDLADRFQNFQDNAGKSTLAAQLFGQKMGPELLPLLNQGGEALRRTGERANVVTEIMAKLADQFGDDLDELKKSFVSIGFTLAKEVLPSLVKLTASLKESESEMQAFGKVANFAVETLKVLAVGMHAIATAFEIVGIAIGAAAGLLIEVWITNIKAAISAVQDLANSAVAAGNVLAKVAAGDFVGALASATQMSTKFAGAMKTVGNAVKQDANTAMVIFDETLASIKTKWKDLENFSLRIFPVDEPVATPLAPPPDKNTGDDATTVLEGIDEANEHRYTVAAETLERLKDLERDLTESNLEGFARQQFQIESGYKKRLDAISNLQVTEEIANELSEKAAAERNKRMRDLAISQAQNAASLLGSLANSAAAFGKKGFAIYKAIATAEAVVSTAAGVARALKDYAWPFNLIVGGIVAAAGAAQIARIHSQKVAHTGLDFVPREESYLLSPGEAVLNPTANREVTKAAKTINEGGGGRLLNLVVNLDGRAIAKWMGDASADGTLQIHARAVV
jgi:hypothetical protein